MGTPEPEETQNMYERDQLGPYMSLEAKDIGIIKEAMQKDKALEAQVPGWLTNSETKLTEKINGLPTYITLQECWSKQNMKSTCALKKEY